MQPPRNAREGAGPCELAAHHVQTPRKRRAGVQCAPPPAPARPHGCCSSARGAAAAATRDPAAALEALCTWPLPWRWTARGRAMAGTGEQKGCCARTVAPRRRQERVALAGRRRRRRRRRHGGLLCGPPSRSFLYRNASLFAFSFVCSVDASFRCICWDSFCAVTASKTCMLCSKHCALLCSCSSSSFSLNLLMIFAILRPHLCVRTPACGRS